MTRGLASSLAFRGAVLSLAQVLFSVSQPPIDLNYCKCGCRCGCTSGGCQARDVLRLATSHPRFSVYLSERLAHQIHFRRRRSQYSLKTFVGVLYFVSFFLLLDIVFRSSGCSSLLVSFVSIKQQSADLISTPGHLASFS